MSGLVCLFDRGSNAVTREKLRQMLDTLSHRGPHGDGAWTDVAVGLGHQQLRTTPEARHDQQPYREDGFVVSADARVDNRKALYERLSIAEPASRVPDSQLLLGAYREWGARCVENVEGAFAFVVWDADAESVFCARDRFGVKPLYYHLTDGAFAVASEVKALLPLSSVPKRLDEVKVGDFLTELLEDKSNTFYETVRRLPPGHAMRIDADRASVRQYWDLDLTRTVTLSSDRAYAQRFRELFEQAVQRRLRTDTTLGVTLSGGLDSSSITAVARDQLSGDRSLHTFSGVFDEVVEADEREYIETLVGREGIEPHYVVVDEYGILADVDAILEYHDEPIYNPMQYMKWLIAKRAANADVGVVLDGAHGDSAVDYGLGLLPQLARTGRWWRLVQELDAMGGVLDVPARQLFLQHVVPQLIPAPVQRFSRRLRSLPIEERRANPTLDPEFARRTGLRDRYRELDLRGSVRTRSARRWQYRSLTTGDMTAFLEANDLTHAAHGIEPRYPFIDKRLIEFSLAIPPTQQLADGWTRMILRRALDDLLPSKILWRPWKTLLTPAFVDALTAEDDAISELVEDPGELERYLHLGRLRETYARFTTDATVKDARVLWLALSLSTWLEDAEMTAT